jgi:DNA-binding transcriptional LysR family regulator
MSAHRGLAVHVEADNQYIDLIEGRIDIALRISSKIEDNNLHVVPLARVEQVLVASPSYLNQSIPISRPEDLKHHDLIPMNVIKNYQYLSFQHVVTSEDISLEMSSRLTSNNVLVAKALCQQGHGIARILYLDAQKDLINGALVEVLPEWKLPSFTLYAIISKHEQQPMKIHRCLEALKQYFCQLPGGRNYREAS